MKEFTIEQKAKAYDEAIERAKEINREHSKKGFKISDDVELKENEDERVRNKLIEFFKGYSPDEEWWGNITQEDILAWLEKQGNLMKALQISNARIGELIEKNYYLKEQLEKQGEQKPVDKKPKFKVGQTIKKEGFNVGFTIAKIEDGFYYNDEGCYFPFTDQDNWELVEQKPADKVESKFHEGEWVVYECGEETATLQITRIVGETYVFSDDSTLGVVDEDTLRLWDITEDAKDGDVLHCWIDGGEFVLIYKGIKDGYITTYGHLYQKLKLFAEEPTTMFCRTIQGHFTPATKEQRDALFIKMKEAGYEWDAEKKKLKKIEQDSCQWPAMWCEDDEYHLDSTVSTLEEYAKTRQNEKPFFGVTLDNISWLKSLKERYTWKPSDKQMKGIECAIKTLQHQLNVGDNRLNLLYDDLKKLKNE